MHEITRLCGTINTRIAESPLYNSEFIQRSTKGINSLSETLRYLANYGPMPNHRRFMDPVSSGASSPCQSPVKFNRAPEKRRYKAYNLYQVSEMYLDSLAVEEITRQYQENASSTWILAVGLHQEELINELLNLMDSCLDIKCELNRVVIFKGWLSLLLKLSDVSTTQQVFNFLKNDSRAREQTKYSWQIMRINNRMADAQYMANFYGVLIEGLPQDCNIETIQDILQTICPTATFSNIEPPVLVGNNLYSFVKTPSLEDAEIIALGLNELLLNTGEILKAGIHPQSCTKHNYSAKDSLNRHKSFQSQPPPPPVRKGSSKMNSSEKHSIKEIISILKAPVPGSASKGVKPPVHDTRKEKIQSAEINHKRDQRGRELEPGRQGAMNNLSSMRNQRTNQYEYNHDSFSKNQGMNGQYSSVLPNYPSNYGSQTNYSNNYQERSSFESAYENKYDIARYAPYENVHWKDNQQNQRPYPMDIESDRINEFDGKYQHPIVHHIDEDDDEVIEIKPQRDNWKDIGSTQVDRTMQPSSQGFDDFTMRPNSLRRHNQDLELNQNSQPLYDPKESHLTGIIDHHSQYHSAPALYSEIVSSNSITPKVSQVITPNGKYTVITQVFVSNPDEGVGPENRRQLSSEMNQPYHANPSLGHNSSLTPVNQAAYGSPYKFGLNKQAVPTKQNEPSENTRRKGHGANHQKSSLHTGSRHDRSDFDFIDSFPDEAFQPIRGSSYQQHQPQNYYQERGTEKDPQIERSFPYPMNSINQYDPRQHRERSP